MARFGRCHSWRPLLYAASLRSAEGGSIDAPLDRYRDVVRPEWIDHNRHLNVGYYLVVFDYATDEFFRWIGLDATHRRERARRRSASKPT